VEDSSSQEESDDEKSPTDVDGSNRIVSLEFALGDFDDTPIAQSEAAKDDEDVGDEVR
jgi:hypothetical protein